MDSLYERDVIAWTEQQARILREAAGRQTNLALDWENIAEELQDLGRSELRALGSEIRRIIQHLLKLEFSTATDPRFQWTTSITDARVEIEGLLESDPGLQPRLPEIIRKEVPRSVRAASRDLRTHGEVDAACQAAALDATHYTQDQILGDWFPGDQAP